MLRIEKLITFNMTSMYVGISYKFTLAWGYVSHACTQITVQLHKRFGTFYRDSALMKSCILNNHRS